jgi:glucosamine--fructose-6-phosphate aminotransferase (isomerizing)
MYGQYLVHNLLGIPGMLFTPSTVTAFGSRMRFPRSAALALSQSGESPDLLDSVRTVLDAGVPVVAITNGGENSLAGVATMSLDFAAGPELSVAASKTYTGELLALHVVVALAAGESWDAVAARVHLAADQANDVLIRNAGAARALALRHRDADRIVIVGRGYAMATAREGALKLMETCGLPASGWSAADATHGPLGQVIPDTPVVALCTDRAGRRSVEDFATAAVDLGAAVARTGPGEDLPVPDLWPDDPALSLTPLLEVLPLQLLALELSLARGLDPDRPAGLQKVTRTR